MTYRDGFHSVARAVHFLSYFIPWRLRTAMATLSRWKPQRAKVLAHLLPNRACRLSIQGCEIAGQFSAFVSTLRPFEFGGGSVVRVSHCLVRALTHVLMCILAAVGAAPSAEAARAAATAQCEAAFKVEERLHELAGVTIQTFAVTSLPDEKKGERLTVIHTLTEEALVQVIEKLSTTDLPNLWKPKRDQFLRVNTIPVLGTGKTDLRQVKTLASSLAENT